MVLVRTNGKTLNVNCQQFRELAISFVFPRFIFAKMAKIHEITKFYLAKVLTRLHYIHYIVFRQQALVVIYLVMIKAPLSNFENVKLIRSGKSEISTLGFLVSACCIFLVICYFVKMVPKFFFQSKILASKISLLLLCSKNQNITYTELILGLSELDLKQSPKFRSKDCPL